MELEEYEAMKDNNLTEGQRRLRDSPLTKILTKVLKERNKENEFLLNSTESTKE